MCENRSVCPVQQGHVDTHGLAGCFICLHERVVVTDPLIDRDTPGNIDVLTTCSIISTSIICLELPG